MYVSGLRNRYFANIYKTSEQGFNEKTNLEVMGTTMAVYLQGRKVKTGDGIVFKLSGGAAIT